MGGGEREREREREEREKSREIVRESTNPQQVCLKITEHKSTHRGQLHDKFWRPAVAIPSKNKQCRKAIEHTSAPHPSHEVVKFPIKGAVVRIAGSAAGVLMPKVVAPRGPSRSWVAGWPEDMNRSQHRIVSTNQHPKPNPISRALSRFDHKTCVWRS